MLGDSEWYILHFSDDLEWRTKRDYSNVYFGINATEKALHRLYLRGFMERRRINQKALAYEYRLSPKGIDVMEGKK